MLRFRVAIRRLSTEVEQDKKIVNYDGFFKSLIGTLSGLGLGAGALYSQVS